MALGDYPPLHHLRLPTTRHHMAATRVHRLPDEGDK